MGLRWQADETAKQADMTPQPVRVEVEITQYRDRTYGEIWIDWGEGEPPKYRLLSGTKEYVTETCERIKRLALAFNAEPPDPDAIAYERCQHEQ